MSEWTGRRLARGTLLSTSYTKWVLFFFCWRCSTQFPETHAKVIALACCLHLTQLYCPSLSLLLPLPLWRTAVCAQRYCVNSWEDDARLRSPVVLTSPAWVLKDSSPGETPSIKRSSYLSRAPFTLCRKIKHERDSLTVFQNPSRILDKGAGSKSKAVATSQSSQLFARLGQTLIPPNEMTCNRLVAAQANVPLNYPFGLV